MIKTKIVKSMNLSYHALHKMLNLGKIHLQFIVRIKFINFYISFNYFLNVFRYNFISNFYFLKLYVIDKFIIFIYTIL